MNKGYAQLALYKNPSAPIETRVKDLLSKMTIQEKILQLNQYTFGINTNVNNIGDEVRITPPGIGSLIYFSADPVLRNQVQKMSMEQSRLGIPILFGFDVIHGFRTVYPISLAQACTWNPSLVKEACGMAAKEAKLSGLDWTFSPMIDIARDARWGRVSEGYGEDPYTNAIFGVASVNGYQGKKMSDPFSIAACLKHYVGYGESEGGRDYHASDISLQSLWETYLVPYEACIKAGAATVMSGFNDISGVPATANYYTLTEVLKKRWNFKGFVVSDWDAIDQLINQGVANNRKEAGYKAFTAGVEMDMKDNIYQEFFPQLMKENKISLKQIDEAVARVLRVKFQLGLFEQPYTNIVIETDRYLHPASKLLAQQLAAESMVLLKNNATTLPLNKLVKQIALIGPIANNRKDLLGSWSFNGKEADVETLMEGIQKEFGENTQINFSKGCDFDGSDESGFDEAIAAAQKSEVILLCLGEKKEWSGENASRSSLALPAIQEKLMQALKQTGKPIILILSNGRPLELHRLEPLANAIVEIWQPGVAGGTALAGILSGRINPSGKLSITFPRTTGQIPVYYNMRQSARIAPDQGRYQDISNEPLYWMGHGLSYTNYAYSTIKSTKTAIGKSEKLALEIEVSNTGDRAGTETVHWYISHTGASISRPIKELKFFEKKEIAAGSKTIFRFTIDPDRDLSFSNADGKKILESGNYAVMVNNQKINFTIKD